MLSIHRRGPEGLLLAVGGRPGPAVKLCCVHAAVCGQQGDPGTQGAGTAVRGSGLKDREGKWAGEPLVLRDAQFISEAWG